MKKLFFTILLLVAAINAHSQNYDFSAVCSTGQTLYYTISSDTTVSVVSPVSSNTWSTNWQGTISGDLVIPDSVIYNNLWYKVTEIGNYAFRDCANIQGLVISDNINSIGQNAFYGCEGVSSVNIGNGVLTIGQFAFSSCSGINSLHIGDNVQNIGIYAFSGCPNIHNLVIPDRVTSIGEGAFNQCSSIDSIYIGHNVQTIGPYAFGGCEALNYMHYNTRSYSSSLFYGSNTPFSNTNTSQFRTLIIGEYVRAIPNNAFAGRSIDSLYIGSDVRSIGFQAFNGCSAISSVIIPNSVTSIGAYAFSQCSGISNLHIGEGVQTIGDHAFASCIGLRNLYIPNGVFSIGEGAFVNCINIDSLYIGANVQTIGRSAFWQCTSLKYLNYNARNCFNGLFKLSDSYYNIYSPFENTATDSLETLIIGDSVEIIPEGAFYGRQSIDSLYIGYNVNTISKSAFYGCSGLKYLYYNARNCNAFHGQPFIYWSYGSYPSQYSTSNSQLKTVIVGDSVSAIPNSAFNYCTGIDSLYLGENVITIGDSAFLSCNKIKRIGIPNSVITIGNHAFQSCDSIRILSIPRNVISIGSSSFKSCFSIDSIYLDCGLQSIGSQAFYGCTGIKHMFYNLRNCDNPLFAETNNSPFANTITSQFISLVIGDSVEVIPSNSFRNRASINKVIIPNNAISVGNYAFYGCSGIDSLVIGNGVSFIGKSAFGGCNSIGRLNIPDNVTTISDSAFYGCSGINDIHIGNGINEINAYVFAGCSNIQRVTFLDGIYRIGDGAFKGCSGINRLAIPGSISSIGEQAFYGCTGIDSLSISNGILVMGDNAFHSCTSLKWLSYNSPIIYADGFSDCILLESLILGDSVRRIEEHAFYNCDNLLTLNTNKTQYIGNNAFANCDRLVSVTLGDSTQTLGNGAFSGCFRLQNIDLGGVTTIGDSAFNGCVRLERPELPANLTTIGSRAFNNCNLLAGKLTFPATISSIGDYAYSGVGTITEIEMQGSNPPTIYANTFASASSSTPVSVPCGAVINYYTTNYWENFSTIVEAPPYKLKVETNNEVMGNAAVSQQPTCSNHSAIIQATAEAGFHFLQWNDGNGSNPRTIQMTQDSTFTAIFVPNNSYIIIEPNNPTMGSTTGTGTYGYNAPVTMTATAYDGYHFLKWNDGNTQNPRYMAAVRDTTFTAIFVSNVSTITVSNANPDWGNVSGSGVYYYQNLVSITATPVYGYHFAQWNDGNTLNPRTITVNQDSSFTAYFAVNTYSIVGTSNSTAMGSVTGSGSYTYQHEMSLTATPVFGYHFVQWNDQNTDNPRTITVTRDSAFTAQFAANSYTITADANDPTMGSAYGSGTYNFNTTATLTAVAEYGYHFTQWSDGVTDNPRTVTVQNSATYTAQFEINSYIITVQSSNPAIGTTSGGGSYNYLTPVNITANPNAGYHFTQWSDGNTDNPRLISVTQNATYVAQFAINSYAVGVTSNNTNMGSVSGSGTYNHNSTATLTATAYYGYHFVQWQDGNTQNPRSVVVTDSTQYIAQFDYNSYLVTANSSNITLGIATGSGTYNYMSQVALTAVPTPHYHFTMWNDSIEDNPRTITVTRDTILTAHFAIDRHTIGVHTADAIMGTASSSDTVDYNTAVWISATANYGYHFSHWNDGNTQNPRRVVVLQDTAFTATFAPNQYTATCNVNDNSRGTVATMGGSYNYLTSLTFTALPDANYHFLRWSNGSTTNPITFNLTQDTTLTAILVGLTANVNDSAMGTVSHSKPSNLVEVVTASPNYGYHFVQWNDGTTDNPRTMNLVGDTSVTAIFAVNNYYVALGVNDESLGSVEGEDEYPYLSTVTITATATEHSHFLQWSDGNTTNPRMLTVTSDTSLTAYFDLDQQFQITVNANDTSRGIVEGSGTYFVGEMVTITATANEHYYFAQWSDGNTSNPRVVTVAGDAVYTAVFEPVMYTLTVTANDYSMGQVIGGGSYAYGTEVTIEARAFGGYHFNGWNDGVLEEQRTITLTEDASYLAIFEKNTGINIAEGNPFVFVSGRDIVITGATNRTITVYDIMGRKIATAEHATEREMLSMPATGVYLIVIDGSKPQKCFVR